MSDTTIRLLCFDLDDTLWSTKQVMIDAEKGVYQLLEELAPILTERYEVMELFQARLGFWKKTMAEEPEMRHQIGTMRRRSMQYILEQNGYIAADAEHISAQAFERFMELRHKPIYFEQAIETLEILRPHYQMAAITNGNACSERLGLGHLFDLHISAEELGIGKPEALPFQTALNHFNLRAEQVVHIGDNPEDDILGAHRMNIHSLWFNPNEEEWKEADFKPSLELKHLSEIPAAILRLQNTSRRV